MQGSAGRINRLHEGVAAATRASLVTWSSRVPIPGVLRLPEGAIEYWRCLRAKCEPESPLQITSRELPMRH